MSKGLEQKKYGGTALLIIDMINDFQHDDGKELFQTARSVAHRIAELKLRAMASEVPVIYVNDNFQEWRASFATTVETVEKNSNEGGEMVSLLRPTDADYYVLKPHRSGFYKTPLGLLLDHLRVSNLILTGITTDMCVLLTAQEARMRGFVVCVPSDCVTALKVEFHEQALDLIERTTDADIRPSVELKFHQGETKKAPPDDGA